MQARSILPGNPQWNYAQFRLQLILSHPNIQILSIQKNPGLHNFLETKQSYFKIDAAIDATEQSQGEIGLYKSNSKKGSIYKCGRIQQQCKLQDGMGSPKIYRMLLFKIAVKNLLPIYQSSSITKEDLYNCTEEYDSVYITTRKQQITVYDHQYFLKSTSQYLWQFDIQYRYVNANQSTSKVRKWNPQAYKCQQCQSSKAYWYCVDQRLLFCRECFQQTHKGKYRNPHQKEILSPFNCHKKCNRSAHNQNPLEFYCFNCKSLKCSKCLADSSHGLNKYLSNRAFLSENSSQQMSAKKGIHEFLPIRDLMKIFQQKEHQTSNQLKQKLLEKIKQVESVISVKAKKFNDNLKQLQEDLAHSIMKLKNQSRKQINEAVSVQIELKRKFDEVLWIEKFVSCNEDLLDAESNIQLKQLFASFITFMNAEEYFRKIDLRIVQMQQKNEPN